MIAQLQATGLPMPVRPQDFVSYDNRNAVNAPTGPGGAPVIPTFRPPPPFAPIMPVVTLGTAGAVTAAVVAEGVDVISIENNQSAASRLKGLLGKRNVSATVAVDVSTDSEDVSKVSHCHKLGANDLNFYLFHCLN
jgi:hypothetical protein